MLGKGWILLSVCFVDTMIDANVAITLLVSILSLCFAAAVTQALVETWQTGLRVFKPLRSKMDSSACQTLLLKTAVLVQDMLEKVETLQRYILR